ncbi:MULTISPECIES: LamB/YcsF family protein [Streptomycetaceae]|uniref:5-oxoprolinase subunit A n=1 Tax=Streptantibioticus cattleyicolor (strain ATCC 35852 / DSM 46488 / JCM 4925 / NBRC 14057 / NRRL 8057) TaxID=1003195 RepID=F8K454_STREN|nr:MULTISPECIES: 5-oxoprolinase subunit PxpA [Streptomycetaceae]AEW92595.1 LamB/YcsF family protein [Streptantibioticus cattleyicolor NRRL 8057 = DSM 46488]MYS57377.1 5-oxoprolinase subunit PxpA [Streptomyces sp. SID5468]CCB72950.1 putative nitrogen-containing heterocycle degradation enzyme [Streptantibioticus cattleyicolor NRRL 8057 = DSM 46488]
MTDTDHRPAADPATGTVAAEDTTAPDTTVSAPVVDLNADLGEGFGRWRLTDDEALLSVVTSANVACGYHGGDPATMRRVCEGAAAHGVAIGAQVSYRDLAGFGRRTMDVPPDELAAEVAYQIGALQVFARAAGSAVRYVKPHGALYNRCVHDDEQARAVVEGVRLAGPGLPVLGLPGSRLHAAAREAGLPVVAEAFADRAYTAAGTLVPRREPGAVVHDPDLVVARALGLARDRRVVSADGTPVEVAARSLCLHGDTPGAAALARRVRAALEAAGVRLGAFA